MTVLLFVFNLVYTAISILCFAVLLSLGFTLGRYLVAKYAPKLVMV